MIKASALYIVIIISLVVSIISGSLIATAYFYRLENQKAVRNSRLLNNLNSGVAILLSKSFVNEEQRIDLFGEKNDSLLLKRERWGIFDLALVKSFALRDTIKRAFLIGKETADKSSLYLLDEDRQLYVSGNTHITGPVFLPKAGINEAFVEGKAFTGGKLVYGKIDTSSNKYPPLSTDILNHLESLFASFKQKDPVSGLPDSLSNSFFNPLKVVKVDSSTMEISGKVLQGKIALVSDTTIHISRNTVLRDILVFAPAIVVDDGFKGNCQMFARDSIIIGKNCTLSYPSTIALLKMSQSELQPRLFIGEESRVSGIVFSYEKERSDLEPFVSVGKRSTISGELFATGLIKFGDSVNVYGKTTTHRFLTETSSSLYENYLVDIDLDSRKRSKYYLSSGLFVNKDDENRIMKWVN